MKKIFRPTLNALVDDYAAGNLVRRDYSQVLNFQRLPKVYVRNDSNVVIEPFEQVWVIGSSDLTIDELQKQYFADGYVLSRTNPSQSRAYGTTLEPINKNGVGEIFLPGITTAWITCSDNSHAYVKRIYGRDTASLNSVSSSYDADFYIIAKSTDTDNGKRFAYIAPYDKQDYNGHLIGYVGSNLTGSNQVDVYSDEDCQHLLQGNVGCPLLRNETITAKSKVVLSWNRSSHIWEIIEAQCPVASAAPLPDGGEEEPIESDVENEF